MHFYADCETQCNMHCETFRFRVSTRLVKAETGNFWSITPEGPFTVAQVRATVKALMQRLVRRAERRVITLQLGV